MRQYVENTFGVRLFDAAYEVMPQHGIDVVVPWSHDRDGCTIGHQMLWHTEEKDPIEDRVCRESLTPCTVIFSYSLSLVIRYRLEH